MTERQTDRQTDGRTTPGGQKPFDGIYRGAEDGRTLLLSATHSPIHLSVLSSFVPQNNRSRFLSEIFNCHACDHES